jgi:hypothetical protein
MFVLVIFAPSDGTTFQTHRSLDTTQPHGMRMYTRAHFYEQPHIAMTIFLPTFLGSIVRLHT